MKSRRNLIINLLSLILVVALSGCSLVVPPSKKHAPSDITPVWKSSQTADGAIGDLDEANELVFVSRTNSKQVLALDAKTGEKRWQFADANLPEHLFAPTYWEGLVFVVSYATQGVNAPNILIALDAGIGRERWRSDIWKTETPQLRGGMFIGTVGTDEYIAVDAKTGTEVFRFSAEPKQWKTNHQGQEIRDKLLTKDGHLLLITSTPSLVVINFRASQVEEFPVKFKGEYSDNFSIEGTTLYRIGYDHIKNQYQDYSAKYRRLFLQAFDTNSGKEKWAKAETMKFYEIQGFYNGVVYVRDWSGNLMAYDAGTGKERWSQPITRSADELFLIDEHTDGKIFMREGGAEGLMRAFDSATGKLLWSVNTKEDPINHLLQARHNTLFLWTAETKKMWESNVHVETQLTAYDMSNGAYLWRFTADDISNGRFFKDKVIVNAGDGVVAFPARK
jgi:outer membrane protein assembly factor BamB